MNECAICGRPITGQEGMRGFTGWANDQGEIVEKEDVIAVCAPCWLRAEPGELDRLLDEERGCVDA